MRPHAGTRLRGAGLVASLGAALVAGCDLAPVYNPPHLLLADSYQGSAPFRVAQPQAALSARGDWWTVFGDPQLSRLEEELGRANPTLAAAAEAYTQARDVAAEAQSGLYPQIGANALLSENKQSQHRLFRASITGASQQASNIIAATASWEPDFWNAIRNRAHAQKRLAQASAADLATARLSLETELASDYIALRGFDAEIEVLRQSIISYGQAVEVTQLRSEGQIASGLDLARALSQLRAAQAQESDTALQRDLMQHAISVLIGAMPSDISIAPITELHLIAPQIPPGVPAQLLERRPDIASAERQMAAANASIGVSRAAFYPNITLSAIGGSQDTGFNLLSLPNSLWSVGAGAMLPLFEGGLRRAELERSWSQYAQMRDNYRSTVLAAFQEVEDGLSLTQRLATEATQQREASEQSAQALSISTMLYQDGLDNYLSVSVAQVQALQARTIEVQVRTRQIQASVALIRALGGGWDAQLLPNEEQTLPFGPLDYFRSTNKD
jgi:NodT family efflux transporter outer membrane factor (OMF) lipoprotein